MLRRKAALVATGFALMALNAKADDQVKHVASEMDHAWYRKDFREFDVFFNGKKITAIDPAEITVRLVYAADEESGEIEYYKALQIGGQLRMVYPMGAVPIQLPDGTFQFPPRQRFREKGEVRIVRKTKGPNI